MNTTYTRFGHFKDKSEAEKILYYAKKIVDVRGIITVADMKDLYGENPTWNDNKIGWTDDPLECALIEQVNPGSYRICMPPCDWPEKCNDDTASDEKKLDVSFSIGINIPSDNYSREPDRFNKIVKKSLDEIVNRGHGTITINIM